jgi:hypothetical protein
VKREHLALILGSLATSTIIFPINVYVYIYIEVPYPVDVAHETWGSHSTVLLRNTHLEEKDRKKEEMFKEIDCSLGKFISYSFRHMYNETEMPMFAIRQSYVQFSMTIFIVYPAVYITHQSSFSNTRLHLIHSMWEDRYMLLFNYYYIIYIHYISLESDYNIIEREFNRERDKE